MNVNILCIKRALHFAVPFSKYLTKPLMVLLLVCATSATAQQEQTEELKDIQKQIQEKQRRIAKQLKTAEALSAELKRAELEIAATAKQLNKTQIALANNQQQQTQLKREQRELEAQLQQQKTVLAKQIRSAYMTGNHDYAKLIFNQENAGKFERVLTYYQYLNKARQTQIDGFRETVSKLESVQQTLVEKEQQLQALQQDQKQQREQLASQQNNRKAMLAKIESSIDSQAAQIEQLQINEQALLKAIEEAARAAQAAPELNGLAKLKGKLLKPASGRMQRLYGTRRQGQVRWKGVLFDSQAGSAVKTVHDGKVLYADWLRGFGLVTVIDHGEGYMSLYGHNQALLKQVGDTVQAGETIALVGQSGGQASPNLYFEIRHKGKALNPSRWLKR